MKNFMHRRFLGIPLALIIVILAMIAVTGSVFAYANWQSMAVTNNTAPIPVVPYTTATTTGVVLTPPGDPFDYTVNGIPATSDSSTVLGGSFGIAKSNGVSSSIIYAGMTYEAEMTPLMIKNFGSTAIQVWTVTLSGTLPAGSGLAAKVFTDPVQPNGGTATLAIDLTGIAPTTGTVDFSGLICTIAPK